MRVLILAPWLPKLSETFVYRDVFGLRDSGLDVFTASVHDPGSDWQEPELKQLAATAVPIYGSGQVMLIGSAILEGLTHPIASMRTLSTAVLDAMRGNDVAGWFARLKVIWQGLAGLALARRLRPLAIEHLHAHMAHVPTTITMYTAQQLGQPFSFTGHAADLFRDRALLAEKLQRAAFVRCISYWHRHFYQSLVPRPDSDYPVIRCGVPLSPPRKSPDAPLQDPPLLLGIGRLVKKKGFDLLIRAVAELREAGQPCRCQIIGDGPEHSHLRMLIQQLKLTDVVELLGALANRDILTLLPGADLFVLPCRTDPAGDKDGIPVVLMEAMASGLPCISGDLPTIRELIADRKTGLLVTSDDLPALTQSVKELLTDPELRQNVARQGQQWVAQEFALEPNIQRLHAALGSGKN